MKKKSFIVLTVYILTSSIICAQERPLDQITFGDPASEKSHVFNSKLSITIVGGLGETARILLPQEPVTWTGGSMAFAMKVDPDRQNYFTVRLWGSDKDKSMIMLFCEGKQVGYRHLGDIDLLYLGNGERPVNDRFFYITLPVPLQSTKGKNKVNLEIRSYGEIWGYGETFDRYQKNMAKPSLGFYKVYTHTDPAFVPDNKEVQGKFNPNPPTRKGPGIEIIDSLKQRVNKELNRVLAVERPVNQLEIMFMAPAYSVKWTPAYQNPLVIDKVIKGIDDHYRKFIENPEFIYTDKSVYNYEWLTIAPISRGIRQLWTEINPVMDQAFDNGKSVQVSRRKAWSEMLQAALKYSTTHRRHYTNQSMIIDMFTYDCNRALMLVDPQNALPEYQTMKYLYESVGLAPWLGSETANGHEKPLGDNYWQLTKNALTKELGFVGYYGEVLDWVVDMYKSTCISGIPNSGDQKIRLQLLKMMMARSYFRYPALDDEGNKAMRIEGVVGWRDGNHYPGNVLYGDRGNAWDATPIMTAAATLDPYAIGFAQQMFDDNQFFSLLQYKMKDGGIRVTKSLLPLPDEYELLKQQAPSKYRLPMSKGMPDFVFSDEEDGVVAIKNGDEILYASLYWRARNAVNKLAKVHYITPTMDRIANIYINCEFDSSGMQYVRPNWVNMGFAGTREFYPGIESAHTGEVLPIAKIPAGVPFKPGDENVFAGKSQFYTMRYGNYLIAMNTTKDKNFDLKIPAEFGNSVDLVSGKKTEKAGKLTVAAQTTIVLYIANKKK